MTCIMVLISLECWMTCRRQTIQCLHLISKMLKHLDREISASARAKDTNDSERNFEDEILHQSQQSTTNLILDQIEENNPKLLTKFIFHINDDLRCFNILLEKLREFLHMIKSTEYFEALESNPEDLFLSITANISAKPQHKGHWGLKQCGEILDKKIEITSKMLSIMSGNLFQLNDLLINVGAEGVFEKEIHCVIDALKKEQDAMMMIYVLPCMDAVEEVRRKLDDWFPHCDAPTTTLKEIIGKLHKMMKEVDIVQDVSYSVGMFGYVLQMLGLALSPVTFGASLGLNIGGAVAGALGGATALSASVSRIVIFKAEIEKANRCIEEDRIIFKEVKIKIKNLIILSSRVLCVLPRDDLESFGSSTVHTGDFADPDAVARWTIILTRLLAIAKRDKVITRKANAESMASIRKLFTVASRSVRSKIAVLPDLIAQVTFPKKLSKAVKKLEMNVADLEERRRVLSNWFAK